jgi:hypothetical protein
VDLSIQIPREVWLVPTNYSLAEETRNDILRAVLEEATDQMAPLVDPYMKHDRGTLSEEVSISDDGVSFDPKTNKGALYINFQEEAYYGCKDMNDFPYHDVEIPFFIDPRTLTLTLTFMDEQGA